MPSRINTLVVRELKQKLGGVDTCFFVDFSGLDGRKAADLRRLLQSVCGQGASLTVVKTSLAGRALWETMGGAPQGGEAAGAPLATFLKECFRGPTAVAYGAPDPALLVRTLADWSRKESLLRFKGGVLSGRAVAAEDVAALARIPPRPVLIAQVVGAAAAPLTSLLYVGQGIIRRLLGLVDALAKKKSE